ncbi:hypothetical protein HPP92_017930 [Vanilla planifolia]|uniref:Uncharacterized protein n=1 Tax=Vanilla planifolia TaxID=51239 RepID=A0A835QGF8_VANPL|nr:hypothetical protein HPP92_017930 [Vanilla planifolia]
MAPVSFEFTNGGHDFSYDIVTQRPIPYLTGLKELEFKASNSKKRDSSPWWTRRNLQSVHNDCEMGVNDRDAEVVFWKKEGILKKNDTWKVKSIDGIGGCTTLNTLRRPYVVILNKIDLPEAAHLPKKISNIGCFEDPNDESSKILPFSSSNENLLPLISIEDQKREKEIQDYPRPLAVVGASVLKHIGVDAVLKEIRAALRKCQDSTTSN